MTGNLRLWGIGSGIGVVAILAGGFFLGVQPALASAADTDAQTASLSSRNQLSAMTLTALSRQNAKLSDMEAQQKVLAKAVPEILKPNTFVRRINEVAAIDNVTVQAITPSDALPYTAPAAAGGAASSTTDTATAPAGGSSPTAASVTSQNFALVPVSVQVTGAQSAVLQFAHDIQLDQRLFSISGITAAADNDGTTGVTFSGYIYTLQR